MHIVIADSSGVVLQILEDMVKSRGDIVTTFKDGKVAYDYICENPSVDLLLTSFELATMSGLELCWETRALSNERDPIYVLVMSSQDDRHTLVQALDSGADDFIRKPPAKEELEARLRGAQRLTSMQKELIRLATIDPLTGVYNRRAFFEKGTAAMVAAKQTLNVHAVMFDIDHFKNVNDTYGHDIGDIAIQQVSSLAENEEGTLGRLGGEEFGIILPGFSREQAMEVCERLRQAISEIGISTEEGLLSFTCSFGVSGMQAGDDIHTILKRADVALYDAKQNGRNQVVCLDS
ncbi:MAG: GGDEF domain-containing response regulator [Methyloligellaceae bacterium]